MVDILSLRRPTKISKLLEELPINPLSLPTQLLPGWSKIPLCQKLPMLKNPQKPVQFRINKVGQKVWQTRRCDPFASYDPDLLRFNFEYTPLRDRHLAQFFKQLIFKERLVFHRLIDCNTDDELCRLKEFNMFRSYLYQLQLNEIHAVLKDQVSCLLH